jgi:hypothetical protein
MLDLSGVAGGGTFSKKIVEQERPSPAASSGKDRAYKAGRLKVCGAGRESEGFVVPMKACSKTRRREGTLLGSGLEGGKCEGMLETAKNPIDKVQQLQRRLWVCAKLSKTRRFHAPYDRIYRSDVLWEAWKRVRRNKGAAGVDEVTLRSIEEQGVVRFLEGIQADLKTNRYRPSPRKRKGFGWKRWSKQWLYGELGPFNGYRVRRPEAKVQLAR